MFELKLMWNMINFRVCSCSIRAINQPSRLDYGPFSPLYLWEARQSEQSAGGAGNSASIDNDKGLHVLDMVLYNVYAYCIVKMYCIFYQLPT